MEAKRKEALAKGEERTRKKERRTKVAEQDAKEKSKKVAASKVIEEQKKVIEEQKAEKEAEKGTKVHEQVLTSQYAADQLDVKSYPVVCPTEEARIKYAPASPPINAIMMDVLNNLLAAAGEGEQYPPDFTFEQKRTSVNQRLLALQTDGRIDDAPGCAGRESWRKLFSSCPFPVSTAYCHEARPCVAALQILLYRWYPAGKVTGKFCKETQIQMTAFQRKTQATPLGGVQLFASGTCSELDFVTLLRRNGIPEGR